jgi:hypothetical protein
VGSAGRRRPELVELACAADADGSYVVAAAEALREPPDPERPLPNILLIRARR